MKNLQLDHKAHISCSKKYPLCFLANDVDSPFNVGSFFRTADALGVEKVYLTGSSIKPPNAKIRKASRSTEKYVPYSYTDNALELIQELKESGYKIVSLEIATSSVDLKELTLKPSEKVCLVLGSEGKGITQELLDASDVITYIPMLGHNSSMNIASACSIAAYEITKRITWRENV